MPKTIFRLIVFETHIVATARLVVAETEEQAKGLALTLELGDDRVRDVGESELIDVVGARVVRVEDADTDPEMARMEISENYGAEECDTFFATLK